MNRNKLLWTAFGLALLSGLYYHKEYITDLFGRKDIQIYHGVGLRELPLRRWLPDNSKVNPVVFGFNRSYRLTSVKVVPVSDAETNKYAHPIWELVSESNSIPVKNIFYGLPIPGMHPAVKGALPDALEA